MGYTGFQWPTPLNTFSCLWNLKVLKSRNAARVWPEGEGDCLTPGFDVKNCEFKFVIICNPAVNFLLFLMASIMQFVQRDFCNQWLQTFFKEQLSQHKVFYLKNKISCFCFPCTCPQVELRIFFFRKCKNLKNRAQSASESSRAHHRSEF